MARITYVKKAQRRYKTVPVIDPETGQQKQTPVMKTVKVRQEDGSYIEEKRQKTNKHGRPVFMRVTEADKSQPLPNHKCDKCGKEIEVGQPYKHISPKSGPYGGRTMYRCGECPGWQVWEYSQSMSARIAQIDHDAREEVSNAESSDDVTSALETAASSVRELAEEKRESAQNMEDGFGHSTTMSEELNEQADSLDSWADEIEQADVPDLPEPEETECEECNGTGYKLDDDGEETEDSCDECDGSGQHTPDEPTEDQMDQWREEVEEALSVLDNSPV